MIPAATPLNILTKELAKVSNATRELSYYHTVLNAW
jgi:hypothetical protein